MPGVIGLFALEVDIVPPRTRAKCIMLNRNADREGDDMESLHIQEYYREPSSEGEGSMNAC